MAEFIHFEAEVSGSDNSENEIEDSSEMKSFINDESESESEQNHGFVNAQIDVNEANARIEQEALERIANCDDYSNLCEVSDEDELSIFEFDDA